MAVAAKQAMSNIDVAALAAELALVRGARVDKVYQPAKDRILVRLRKTGAGRTDLLFQLGKFLTATKRPPENPDKPSMLAQVLRTELENGRVTAVTQLGFDRLLRLTVERGDGVRHLVFELFGDGNLLLLDADGCIKLPLRGEDFAARSLRKGEPYQPPPAGPDPLAMDLAALRTAAHMATQKDLVRWLASGLGFGPAWAEEMCLRSGLDKGLAPTALGDPSLQRLHDAVAALAADVRGANLAPALVYPAPVAGEEPEPVDAVPLTMARYPAPAFSVEEFPTFREALDAYFVGGPVAEGDEEPEDPRRPRYEEARGKLLRQVEQTRTAAVDFAREEERLQADGQALYGAFAQLGETLATIDRERQARGWGEVERVLAAARKAGHPAASRILALHPHEGTARVRLDAPEGVRELDVDVRRSVQDNAQELFAAAKKARSRREGAQWAQAEAEARVRALEKAGLDAFGAAPVRAPAARHHFWFEAYRWTLTPSGLVAVGGRNASQNDAVVKKYLRDGDRYVHADIHGAPSVVVRPYDAPAADVPEADVRAAAQFAAMASRAWRLGATASAYWVTAQQVSKTPRSGEFVPRGAWIIHGRRNVEDRLPMEWWVGPVQLATNGVPLRPEAVASHVGRVVRKLVGGPRSGLEPFGAAVVHLVPGTVDPNEVAQVLARKFAVTPEEAQAALPAGPVRVVSGLDPAELQGLEGAT